MKINGAALFALAILIPAASCADAETDSTADTETNGTAASNDVHVYSTGGLELDCPQGFENLQAEAIAMDGMELVTETDEQIAYMAGPVSFTLTKDGHYAHPMIIRRDVVVGDEDELSVNMAACGYGPKEGADKAMKRFDLLNERFLLQQKIQIKSEVGENFEITDEELPEAADTE